MKRLLVTLFALAAIAGAAPLFSGANFAVQTLNPQTATAATDFVAPTVGSSVIADTASGTPFDGAGYVAQGGTYRIYANVTDAGNPASGVATVTADVTSVSDGGHAAVPLVAGSFTVGGVTYNYASAEQTAITPLSAGSKGYTVSAVDNASNASSAASFSVTVDNTAPTIDSSTIARADGVAPGYVRQGDSYYVYANASDVVSGIHDVTANVNTVTTGQTAAALTTTGGPWTVNGVSYAYRSASLTANASLTDGPKAYSISARDNATNAAGPSSFGVIADSTAPSIAGSVIATTASGTPIDGPGVIRAGGSYRVYAEVSDAGVGVASVKADVSSATAGQTAAVLTFNASGVSLGGTTYHWISAELTADSTLTAGSKSYSITAADTLTNSGSQSFSVTADNTAPTVSLKSPTSSTAVSGTISPSATATDANGIAFVTIQRSPAGANTWTTVCTATGTSPYSCSFDTTTVADGLYDLRAVATDKGGNTANSTAATNVRIDNTAPVVTMANPGTSLSGTVTLSSSSATDTGGSGVASVKYQYAPTGTTTWTDACTSTTGPSFSCSFDTTALTDGGYDFRAIATDNAGNTGTSAAINNRQVTNAPVGVRFDATNCTPVSSTCVVGQANPGDTISFTYNKPIDPATLVPATTNPAQPAWDGTTPRSVKVNLTDHGSADTLTEVELDIAPGTTVSLGSVNLGSNYVNSGDVFFKPSAIAMTNGGRTFSITFGPVDPSSTGGLRAISSSTVVWTPSAVAKDFSGQSVSTLPVSRTFPAF